MYKHKAAIAIIHQVSSTTVGAKSSGSEEKSQLYFFVKLSLNFKPRFTRSRSTPLSACSKLEKKVYTREQEGGGGVLSEERGRGWFGPNGIAYG